jgi:hypothetical protein
MQLGLLPASLLLLLLLLLVSGAASAVDAFWCFSCSLRFHRRQQVSCCHKTQDNNNDEHSDKDTDTDIESIVHVLAPVALRN